MEELCNNIKNKIAKERIQKNLFQNILKEFI